jgi:hypothetical protein
VVGISTAWYMLPDESDYIQPTIRIDRGWLHLETRYVYEDRHSLSFFGDIQRRPLVGITFSSVEAAFYLFNPDDGDRLAVFSLGLSF